MSHGVSATSKAPPAAPGIAAIRAARIYDRPRPEDGRRVLVDRLWPRGLKRAGAPLDLWLPDVAPSAALRKWFAHDPARMDEFRHRYQAELLAADAAGRLEPLWQEIGHGSLTLLTAARDPEISHAAVLRDYLRDRLAVKRGR